MRFISYNSFCYFKLTILFCIFSTVVSCSTEKIKKSEKIRFALINNTLGESPYSGLGPKLKPVIKKINDDNPVFLAHLGSMVCGGTEWFGITKIDIERQYSDFYSEISTLLPIFYTVKGESDLFNNSSDYYMKYSGKKDYYSFNYGNLHFLVLDSTGKKSISLEQKNWIKKDLEQTKNSGDIFIFIHDPLFVPVKFKSSEIEVCKDSDLLHQYFKQYQIKAVFSGYRSVYFKIEVDGVLYINAGCGGFNSNDLLNGYYQYYVADYKNGELNIQPKYVNSK